MKPIARVFPSNWSRDDFNRQKLQSNNNFESTSHSVSNLPYNMHSSSFSRLNESSISNTSYSDIQNSNSDYGRPSMNYAFESHHSSNMQHTPRIATDSGSNSYSYNSSKLMNNGEQGWVKRYSLKRPTPYSIDRLNPDQGLGRSEDETLDSMFPNIRLYTEGRWNTFKRRGPPFSKNSRIGQQTRKDSMKLETKGKHPVSILEEYCIKRRLPQPKYTALIDEGPVHAKHFLFQVQVDGSNYKADKGSNVKKTARLEAAKKCLTELGILPKD